MYAAKMQIFMLLQCIVRWRLQTPLTPRNVTLHSTGVMIKVFLTYVQHSSLTYCASKLHAYQWSFDAQ